VVDCLYFAIQVNSGVLTLTLSSADSDCISLILISSQLFESQLEQPLKLLLKLKSIIKS